jgi:hypothetical protein
MTAISAAELKRYLSFVSVTVIQVYQCTRATVWKLFTDLKLSVVTKTFPIIAAIKFSRHVEGTGIA